MTRVGRGPTAFVVRTGLPCSFSIRLIDNAQGGQAPFRAILAPGVDPVRSRPMDRETNPTDVARGPRPGTAKNEPDVRRTARSDPAGAPRRQKANPARRTSRVGQTLPARASQKTNPAPWRASPGGPPVPENGPGGRDSRGADAGKRARCDPRRVGTVRRMAAAARRKAAEAPPEGSGTLGVFAAFAPGAGLGSPLDQEELLIDRRVEEGLCPEDDIARGTERVQGEEHDLPLRGHRQEPRSR
jgi:hypothetical protein